MAKIKPERMTRGLSVTLPIDIINKLNLYVNEKKNLNVSKTIKLVLEKFFDQKGYQDLFPELKNDEFLIPIEIYSKLLGVGKNAIHSRAAKGEIEITTLYDSDYIRAKPDDILNLFAQILDLKKQIATINQVLLESNTDKKIQDMQKQINDLSAEVERLKEKEKEK